MRVLPRVSRRMSNLDVPFQRFDVQFVKAFVWVSRTVGVGQLQTHQQIDFFEKRIEAHRRRRALKESATAGFVRQSLQTALAIEHQGLHSRRSGWYEDRIDRHRAALSFSDGPLQINALTGR